MKISFPIYRVEVCFGAVDTRIKELPSSGYAYETDIPNLGIGDIVMVPPSGFRTEPVPATVVRVGSDYKGPIKKLRYLIVKNPSLRIRNRGNRNRGNRIRKVKKVPVKVPVKARKTVKK